ncbi:MAG: hypothetical protein GY903_22015, partial [Fuerstiella sp.]|nr:hypothetical protein [Fuerstiella sp.]
GAVVVSMLGSGGTGTLLANVDFQFTFFVFFCLVLLVWRGAGPLSLDSWVLSETEKDLAAT